MRADFRILSVAGVLPQTVLTNEELCGCLETAPEWIESRTGIRARHLCKEQTLSELAAAAASRALDQAGTGVEDLSVIIAATSSPDRILPGLACQTSQLLGRKPGELIAFDVQAACCGFLMALQSGAKLLQPGQKALIIGAEQLSGLCDWSDRSSCILFGDGAGAVVIESHPDSPVWFWNGWKPDTDDVLFCPGPAGKKESLIRMKGHDVFRFALRALPEAAQKTAALAGRDVQDADWIIPHQANARILERAAAILKADRSKVLVCLEETANTSAASIPLALAHAQQQGLLQDGDEILLCAFGAGLSYGGAYLRWNRN